MKPFSHFYFIRVKELKFKEFFNDLQLIEQTSDLIKVVKLLLFGYLHKSMKEIASNALDIENCDWWILSLCLIES